MKKLIPFIFCLFQVSCERLNAQSWEWVTPVRSAQACLNEITVIGNSAYASGSAYGDTVYFPGSDIPVPPYHSFLIKEWSDGRMAWVRDLGAVTVAGLSHSNENVFAFGTFHDEMKIDNSHICSRHNSYDIYLAAFDTMGYVKQLHAFGGPGQDHPYSLCADTAGRTWLLAGIARSSDTYSSIDLLLIQFGKYGEVLQRDTLPRSIIYPNVSVSSDEDVFVSGTFIDTLKWSDSIITASQHGAFLAKMQGSAIQWINIYEGLSGNYVLAGKPAVDEHSNTYLPLASQGNFASGTHVFSGPTVLKTDRNGNVKKFMQTGLSKQVVRVMPDRTIGISGSSVMAHKIFKLDSDLDILFSSEIGFGVNWGLHELTFDVDKAGNFLLAGNTTDSLFFRGGEPGLSGAGQQVYFAKLGGRDLSGIFSDQQEKDISFTIFPNPAHSSITINLSRVEENAYISVYDLSGNAVFKNISVRNNVIQVDLSGHTKGVYFVQLDIGGKSLTQKVVLE